MSTEKQPMRQLVRLVDVDIPGARQLIIGMCKVKGVSHSLANAICNIKNLDPRRSIGLFSEEELAEVESMMKNPLKFNIPLYMINRRRDYESGEDKHLIGSDVRFTKENDIKRMRMMKSYKGWRHGRNLPVRGQRTKAHFRHGSSLGVAKKKDAKSGRV